MRILAVIAALAALAGAQTVGVRLEERKTADAQPRITFPQIRLTLREARPRGLKGVPKLTKDARYAHARIGGRALQLAFDAIGGSPALGVLHTGIGKGEVGRARADAQSGSLLVDFHDVAAPGVRIDVRLYYRGSRLVDAILQPARHRRGRAVLAANLFEVILIDADADGAYNGERDRWVALRVARLRSRTTLRRAEALLLGEPVVPFEKDGRAFMISGVAADGSQCNLTLGGPKKTQQAVLDRRYREVRSEHFRRFKREAEGFRLKHELARPRVKKRAQWRNIRLSEARTVAQEEGKPLLVLFYTETNAWCFRYLYYTFPDREVDALLRKFVLVRIDAEKDDERAFQSTGARLVPALLPLTAAGQRIRFPVRSRDQDGRVRELRQPEEMISGWQRPQELLVNLKRILDATQ